MKKTEAQMVKALKIVSHIALFWLIIASLLVIPAMAEANNCELLAKEYQREYGGDLILVQPLKDNGAYELDEYSGHWMNKAYNKEMGIYYYDPFEKAYYDNPTTVKSNFELLWNKKVEVFNYNKGEVPFGIIWHY